MKTKGKIILTLIAITYVIFSSCTGLSKTGRATIIVRAKEEAKKKGTTPVPNTIIKDIKPIIEGLDDIVTPKEAEIIENSLIKNKINPAIGKLIQIEGLVLKEVRKLTIDLNTSNSQLDQISKMKMHVQKKWHYIFDPAINADTWRSAEATISLKHKGKYPGDCDDYAILLASFARQIGLKSRVVAGFDGDSGHAFAEFQIKKNDLNNRYLNGFEYRVVNDGTYWVSLDWFNGKEHNRFIKNTKILYGI